MVDAGGVSKIYSRALPLLNADYRVSILRDDDKQPDRVEETIFEKQCGAIFKWRDGMSIEGELFACVSEKAVTEMLSYAIELHGSDLVDEHISSMSMNSTSLEDLQTAAMLDGYETAHRSILARASGTKKNPWFKTVTAMEKIGREIVGPELKNSDKAIIKPIAAIFKWSMHA